MPYLVIGEKYVGPNIELLRHTHGRIACNATSMAQGLKSLYRSREIVKLPLLKGK